MIGCSLIIVLRDILMCSILATTCMQGLYIICLEVNLFYMSCRERTTITVINQTVASQSGIFFFITDETCFQTKIKNSRLNKC